MTPFVPLGPTLGPALGTAELGQPSLHDYLWQLNCAEVERVRTMTFGDAFRR